MKNKNSLFPTAHTDARPLRKLGVAAPRMLFAKAGTRITLLVALFLLGNTTSAIGRDATFELSSLDGRNGFVINGDAASNTVLRIVSSAGDINGDGFDDLLFGVSGASFNGNASGASYVVFGGSGVGANGTQELSDLNGANGFVIHGAPKEDPTAPGAGGRFGSGISAAGDINNDGIDDLLIGAPFFGTNKPGASYVVFGSSQVGASGVLELSSLDGTNGFVFNGLVGSFSGEAVSAAGDVNGDGIDDLIIGAVGQASCYVVFGGSSVGGDGVIEATSLNGSNGFVIGNVEVGVEFCSAVSAAGDVNDDGIGDLLIGAPGVNINGSSSGAIYVVFGASNVGSDGFIEASSLDGTNGFMVVGLGDYTLLGKAVSDAGDINGDGIDDLLIGALRSSYVIFGAAEIGAGGVLESSSLNGNTGFVLTGILSNTDAAASGIGDFNNDGFDDLLIGSNSADSNGHVDSGVSYVVFGASDVGVSGALALPTLDGDNGFAINGVTTGDSSGKSVSHVGDVNGDGINDLLIGALGADVNDFSGAAYVVFGQNSDVPTRVIIKTQIATASDDAEEKTSGTVNHRSSDLDLGEKLVGMHFTSVSIPAGATVTRAYVQFDADETNSNEASFQLVGEASDHSLAIGSSLENISARTKTTASTAWAPDAWIAGDADILQQTSDISAIVQEIVNRPGWSNGNALTIIVSGSGKRVAVSHDKDPARAASLHVEYTLDGGSISDIRVANILDDAEEGEDGSIQRHSSDLELGFNKSEQQTVGIRFNNVNIPQGSTITSANIQFQADETDSVATNLVIEGEATDHALAYTTSVGSISARIRTQATIAWAPPPWTSIGEAGPNQQTPDISAIVQEVVGRSGWQSGNALGIVITGSGQRTAESYNGKPDAAPLLHLEYTLP